MINLTIQNNCLQFGGSIGVIGKWKCIHTHVFTCPASLCIWVEAFNPLTFKVIINIYDPITVCLIVLGLLSVGLLLVFCFLFRNIPLAIVVKLVWWF